MGGILHRKGKKKERKEEEKQEGGRKEGCRKNLKTHPKLCLLGFFFSPNPLSVDLLISIKADNLNSVKTLQNISSCLGPQGTKTCRKEPKKEFCASNLITTVLY